MYLIFCFPIYLFVPAVILRPDFIVLTDLYFTGIKNNTCGV